MTKTVSSIGNRELIRYDCYASRGMILVGLSSAAIISVLAPLKPIVISSLSHLLVLCCPLGSFIISNVLILTTGRCDAS
jgi:hypothetical protein